MRRSWPSGRRVARIVRQCLEAGNPVEIDGLGTFRPAHKGGFEFIPELLPRIFIAYVEEDLPQARRLYHSLAEAGYSPWLDKEKLLPGQNWPRSIERAIEVSDFVIACFSTGSISKRGHFQCELRYAMDCAAKLPLDDVFLIPVRLEECPVPREIRRRIQYVDLFPNWDAGVRTILRAVARGRNRRTPDSRLAV